jgi:hypothetical protein
MRFGRKQIALPLATGVGTLVIAAIAAAPMAQAEPAIPPQPELLTGAPVAVDVDWHGGDGGGHGGGGWGWGWGDFGPGYDTSGGGGASQPSYSTWPPDGAGSVPGGGSANTSESPIVTPARSAY